MMNKVNADLQQLYKVMSNEPTIKDPSKVLFSIDRQGPLLKKKQCLVIEGSVADSNELKKVEQIVEQMNLEYEVINNLKISAPKI